MEKYQDGLMLESQIVSQGFEQGGLGIDIKDVEFGDQ